MDGVMGICLAPANGNHIWLEWYRSVGHHDGTGLSCDEIKVVVAEVSVLMRHGQVYIIEICRCMYID